MCHEDFLELPCRSESARVGRRRVVERLGEWGITPDDVAYPQLHSVALVASELLTNAVKFCTGKIRVNLTAHHDHIEIAVTDDNPQLAEVKHSDPLSTGGRGLQLVQSMAETWGQRRGDCEKTVWARLTIPAGSRVAYGCAQLDPASQG
jgi:two-component sensor histidine kinase